MPMQNKDRDWLDQRMAVQDYIPDNGFTAGVVARLPKTRSDAAGILRRRILFLSTLLAAGLLIVQMVPLAQGVGHLASRYSPMQAVEQFAILMRQPGVIYGSAGCIILLGFASIPFFRRWV